MSAELLVGVVFIDDNYSLSLLSLSLSPLSSLSLSLSLFLCRSLSLSLFFSLSLSILYLSISLFVQIDYFGLQYLSKDGYIRWVDRDKSLRKQLEKYHIDGARNAELRFYVQYYVTNVTKLEYEITKLVELTHK